MKNTIDELPDKATILLASDDLNDKAQKQWRNNVRRTPIDLILTDLWVPEMNDREFTLNVRRLSQYNNIPIIAVTADGEQAKNFDMCYFTTTLIKPVKLASLQKQMSSMNGGSQKGRTI